MERRTQQERTEESRQRLLTAAMVLFGTKGYTGTTLTDIGREAGISRGLVAYHFGSKEGCMRAVLEEIRTRSRRFGSTGLGDRRGLAALEHVAENYLRSYVTGYRGGRTMFVAIVESISSTPELQPLTTETDDVFREVIAERLREAIEDSDLPDDTDIHTHSILLVGLLRGLGLQWLVSPTSVDLDDVVPATLAMIRASLDPPRAKVRVPDGRRRIASRATIR